jgi:hypothetical protein
LQNSTITGNTAFAGGGGVASGGRLTIDHSTISHNTIKFGQGGGVANGGTATITNSLIADNEVNGSGGHAGGGVANGGQLTMRHSTIVGNCACGNYSEGGGVWNVGTLTVDSSTLSGNLATDSGGGGGVSNKGGHATIVNSTISGNGVSTDYGGGGGVLNVYGTMSIINSTITGNTSNYDGGVLNRNLGLLTLTSTLIAGNNVYNPYVQELIPSEVTNGGSFHSPGTVIADAFNLFGHDQNAGVSGFTPGPTDIVPTVPLNDILNPTLADNGGPTLTHALVSGSPAIDAVATGCPPPDTDQRGFLRPADGDNTPGALCDVGAFEFNAAPAALEVSVDIKPGESPNTINPKNNGVIAVAILSTSDFDATTVDPLSVEFGPEGAFEAHGKGHLEDINKGGKKDLVLHFRTQDTGIACGDTSISLTGGTFNGDLIQGADSIKTAGCKKP